MAEPVFNLDLDNELLSHLPDPDAWQTLRDQNFRAVLILDEDIRAIYKWQERHLRDHGKIATAEVLIEEFDLDLTEPLTAIGDLIERMRLRYMKTEGEEALERIAKQYEADPLLVPNLLVTEGRELVNLLVAKGEMYGTGDFGRSWERYLTKATAGIGPSLGFETLDEYFFGQRGISIFLGPPKSWKSWFMVQAHIANALKGVYPWLYSLELPAEETDMRMRCMLANVPWWKYVRNALSRDDQKSMEEISECLDEMGVFKTAKPPEGERSLDALVGKAVDAGARVVAIDQLQYVEVDGKSLGAWNETGKYFEVLNRARNLSDDVPILFAHQFNRSTMNADSMPDVKQAKGSASIEETATLVLGLWASKEMRKAKQIELGTLATRNHDFRNWEVAVDLSKRCRFDIIGVVDDD